MIRLLLLAAVASSALAGVVHAADLPVAPAYYPNVVTPSPSYNWGGFYVGINGGGSWITQNGIKITPGDSIQTSTQDSGFTGGGQIGYNWFVVPSFVFSVEGDFNALVNSDTVVTGKSSLKTENRFVTTLRDRFGLVADRFMIYATGGVAWGNEEYTRTQISGTLHGATPGTVETASDTRIGWTAGAGVEYAFAPNWLARAEYLYVQLNSNNYTFPVSESHVQNGSEPISLVRVGVNYKFGFGG